MQHKEWTVEIVAEENPQVWETLFEQLLPKIEEPERILKHNHLTKVGTFKYNNQKYIVKQFISQQTWFWFQWTSIFFPSLGEVALRNSLRLKKAGILTPEPILLMQKVKDNMVINSRFLYRYMEGNKFETNETETIVEILKKLHKAGLIHRDPHPGNFLHTDKGVGIIDTSKIRSTHLKYLFAYDVVLLSNIFPDAPKLYGKESLGCWLPIAKVGHSAVRFYRNGKYGIRKMLGIKRKNSDY